MKALLPLVLCVALVATPARAGEPAPNPDLPMSAGLVVDADSGKVLWTKNHRAPRPPASLTKMLTALLVLERVNLDDQVVITPEMVSVEGASMGAQPGWTFSARDLLWGLLLQSGNDAALALATKASPDGTIPGFVNLMNERAAEMGAKDSRFLNPHGLDEPGHVSTSYDLAVIAVVAMRDPRFANMVGTKSREVVWGDGSVHTYYNVNKLLSKYPGAIGIKTGYTTEAGRNLASAVTRNGSTLMTIALGAQDHYGETIALYDWVFANLDSLRAGPGRDPKSINPKAAAADLGGLEVVEYDPTAPGLSSTPPLAAPSLALVFAIFGGRWIRRRRRVDVSDVVPQET